MEVSIYGLKWLKNDATRSWLTIRPCNTLRSNLAEANKKGSAFPALPCILY
jgi:hypothetical protein